MIDLHSIGRAIAALDGRGVGDDFTSVAEEIQRSLLDINISNERGIETGVRAAPGRLAGGDYVDAVVRPGAPTIFAIGDVSGKSLPSALKALSLKFAIRALLTVDPHALPRALEVVNVVMGQVVRPDEYISALLCRIPESLDRLQFASAGHDPPIVYRARTGTIDELQTGGLVLGVEPGSTYRMLEAPLAAGDIVALYTDGFTEARNSAGEQFTLAQLKAGLLDLRSREPQELADALFERIEEHTAGTFRDDASIVILRITP